MVRKINRTGEERLNKFGSKMIIKNCRKAIDLDVYFPEYDWVFEHATYDNFKNGRIKCPYERRIFGVGYLGEGKYKAKENNKNTDEYIIWYDMIKRCYNPKLHEKYSTYKGCEVENFFLNFQNMAEWIKENYYEVPGEQMCLDKDVLYKGNKIYSRDTCIFVPQRINKLFVKHDNARGNCPIGVTPRPSGDYVAQCWDENGKQIPLGVYLTKEEAFQAYRQYKEKVIKEVIDSYKGKIPEPYYTRLREAMYNYRVEIDD